MADGTVVIDSRIDDDGITRGLAKIKDKLKGLNASLVKTAALGTAIKIAPAVVPAIAAATGATMALGSAFVSAGVGVAGFGAVAIPTLKGIFEANENIAKAEEKLQNAKDPKEKAKALEELRQATEGLSEGQKEALATWREFTGFWDEFAAKFEQPVIESFTSSITALKKVLQLMEPAIQGAAKGINNLLKSLNQSLGSSDVLAFFEYVGDTAQQNIETFGKTAGNVLKGFMNLMRAFSPLSLEMNAGLLEMSESFAEWTSSLSGSEKFQSFVDYIRENGPLVLSIIGDLVMTIVNLGIALAPLGEIALNILANFASLFEQLSNGSITVAAFVDGILSALPQLFEIGLQMSFSLLEGLISAIPDILTSIQDIISQIIGLFIVNLPNLLMMGMELLRTIVTGIVQVLPELTNTIIQLATAIVDTIVNNLPMIITTGTEILLALVDGIVNNLPQLIEAAITLIVKIAGALIENLPQIIDAGIKILFALIDGIIDALPDLTSMIITEVIPAIVDTLSEVDLFDIGKRIIQGLIDGFTSLEIPTPHFTTVGKLDVNPMDGNGISFPSIDVEWYAKGGLFPANSPRLVGIGDNKSYQEAALPLSPSVLGMIGSKIADEMPTTNSGGNGLNQPIIIQIPLDGEVIAEVTYDPISKLMNQNMFQSRRRL